MMVACGDGFNGITPFHSDGAQVYVYNEENGEHKAGNDMNDDGKMKKMYPGQNIGNAVGIQQKPSCYYYQRQKDKHHKPIGDFLQRIEFLRFAGVKGMWFTFKESVDIEAGLLQQIGPKAGFKKIIKLKVACNNAGYDIVEIVKRKQNPTDIMNADRGFKRDKHKLFGSILQVHSGDDKQNDQDGIHQMPDANAGRVEV
jgi:hypothetical protein